MSIKAKLLTAAVVAYQNHTVTQFNIAPLDLWALEIAIEAYEAAKPPVDVEAKAITALRKINNMLANTIGSGALRPPIMSESDSRFFWIFDVTKEALSGSETRGLTTKEMQVADQPVELSKTIYKVLNGHKMIHQKIRGTDIALPLVDYLTPAKWVSINGGMEENEAIAEAVAEALAPLLSVRERESGKERVYVGCCVSCNETTEYACSDCKIDTGKTVYVCGKKECRETHEASYCTRNVAKLMQEARAKVKPIVDKEREAENIGDLGKFRMSNEIEDQDGGK